MPMTKHPSRGKHLPSLPKAPTGITGFDEITGGGIPRGRPTLVSGGAGCGKTLFSMEFLVRGATEFAEPGLFMSFEENEHELAQNVASLGFDLAALVKRRLLSLDFVGRNRARSRRPASTILKACSSGSLTPSITSRPSGSYWIRSKRCSPRCRTNWFFAPNYGGSSAGSRTGGSRR